MLPLTGEVVERSPGCPCCGLRLDVVDALVALHRRRHRPRRVLLLLGPDDDPLTVVQTLLTDTTALRIARLDAVIVGADGPAVSARLGAGLPELDAREALLVAVADRLAIGRASRLTDDALDTVTATLADAAPLAEVLTPQVRRTVVADLVDLDAWNGPITPRPAPPQKDVVAAELVVPGAFDLGRLETWGDQVTSAHGPDLYRIQGIVWIDGEDRPHQVQGVRAVISGARLPVGIAPGERHRNRLTVVGRGIDVDELRIGLFDAVAT